MTDTLAKKLELIAAWEKANQEDYEKLLKDSGGQMQMDTSDKRREMFIEHLVEWGIITPEQVADFDIAFHEQVADAITEGFKIIREAKKKKAGAPKLVLPNQAAPKLVDGQGRPFG